MAEQIDLIKNISDSADAAVKHVGERYPENLWMFDVQKAYWNAVNRAHEEGKPLIFMGACAPMELIYAFDGVPLLMDMIATRCCTEPEMANKYVDVAEKHVPSSMCGIDKIPIGAILSGDFVQKPDAYIYSTVPCDSSRVSYPFIAEYYGVPSYCMDIPFRKDEQGYRYIAKQNKEIVSFLEHVTGKKLDWDKLEEIMEISNKTNILMKKIADLRKNKPCPLPGAVLFLNQLIPAMAGSPDMLKCLQAQYQVGKYIVDKGLGSTKKENFRVLWLQNMLWIDIKVLGWMEKVYGAAVVMEAFGYQETALFDDFKDPEAVYMALAKKALALPMIHGASGPVEDYMKLVDQCMTDYDINVAMYVGHVACKHTWAAEKIIKDMIMEKYGVPAMSLDVDAIDRRYKSSEEIKAVIGEFLDTLLESKKA